MKTALTAILLSLSVSAMAQTIVQSMQTTNNKQTLAMNVVGTKDGRPFRHTLRFDVAGLSQTQRDSLYQQTLQVLAIMGIKNVPGMKQDQAEADTTQRGSEIVFACESCTGKGRLEIYGNNYVHTRSLDPKRDPDKRFPLIMRLSPGEYRYKYFQKGVQQMDQPFVVKAGEKNVVTVK